MERLHSNRPADQIPAAAGPASERGEAASLTNFLPRTPAHSLPKLVTDAGTDKSTSPRRSKQYYCARAT